MTTLFDMNHPSLAFSCERKGVGCYYAHYYVTTSELESLGTF